MRRIIHTSFSVTVPKESGDLAIQLADAFIDWLTSQTDVYVRKTPEIMEIAGNNCLVFRVGIDRNPNQEFPGKKRESVKAWEEVGEIDGVRCRNINAEDFDFTEVRKKSEPIIPWEPITKVPGGKINIQEIQKQRIRLYEKLKMVCDIVSSCKELFEDFTDNDMVANFMRDQYGFEKLKERVRLLIPIPCPCGSFEFKEERIVHISDTSNPHALRLGGNCREEVRYKYVCVNCGTEVK